MSKPRTFQPMPGYAVIAPIEDAESRIVLPSTAVETGIRFYIVALGSKRLPSQAGFIDIPLEPGMEVVMTQNTNAQQPDPTVKQYIVRIYDITGFRKHNDGEARAH